MFQRVRNRLFPGRTIGARLEEFAGGHLPRPRPLAFEEAIEVLVPCYNHGRYLADAIDSVRSQTWTDCPITLTLIDDASTDDTPEIIAGVANSDRMHVRKLRNAANLRQWGSLNRAIESSESALFVVLNDDDLLVPDAIEKIVATLIDHSELYMVGGSSIWFEGGSLPDHRVLDVQDLELTVYSPASTAGYRELNDLNLTHSSSAFFRAAWEAAGGYRPRGSRIHPNAAEDRDFQMRVNALFPVGVFRNYPLAYWRIDSSHGHEY